MVGYTREKHRRDARVTFFAHFSVAERDRTSSTTRQGRRRVAAHRAAVRTRCFNYGFESPRHDEIVAHPDHRMIDHRALRTARTKATKIFPSKLSRPFPKFINHASGETAPPAVVEDP